MEFGILGLELSGKSTLFSLLTGHTPQPSHGRREAHVGVAHVPDHRLDRIAELFRPRKTTPATVRFVDVPAITRGGTQALNLPELRTMDGLTVVLRAFPSPLVPHPEGRVDPAQDLELIETELLLADLAQAEARLDRVARDMVKRRTPDLQTEQAALERCHAHLAAGTPLREADLDSAEQHRLKGFAFLTAKPLLVVLNVGEDDAADLGHAAERAGLTRWHRRPRVMVSAVCATLEEEVARLSGEDQAVFLADLGLPDRAHERLLRVAYSLLGLISFITTGEEECRSWSIPEGTPALKAAGVVHSDFERGFIRAEVVNWKELLEAESFAACRTRGTLRLEGRDYVVRDGDVIIFRFAV